MNKIITSFAPISNSSARVLILGSMPGVKSLNAGQYYAHRQNTFWKILGELTGLNPAAPYAERLEQLVGSGIALWDVLHSCEREGSLDAAIDFNTIRPNDFVTFFHEHPHIKLVCFNGAVAEQCYKIHVLPAVRSISITYARLPSTSPAHAALSFQDKAVAWRVILDAQLK